MKIINTGEKPYEWTWDSCNFGPLMPGQVMELPEPIGRHAIKRSFILDEMGIPIAQTVEEFLPKKFGSIMRFDCPMKPSGECNAAPFKSGEELVAHMQAEHLSAKKAKKFEDDVPSAQARR